MKARSAKGEETASAPALRYATLRHALVGELLMVADGYHLVRSVYTDCELGRKQKGWIHDPAHSVLREAALQLGEYLEGQRAETDGSAANHR